MKNLESRLDKLYDRMRGELMSVSLIDGRQISISKSELLRLLVATIRATASEAVSEDEECLRPEDAAFLQSIAPGQDNVIDLMQSMIASIGSDEDD